MLRIKTIPIIPAFAAVVALVASTFVAAAPAAAEPGQTITVNVVRDLDGNGWQGPMDDTPVQGMNVSVTGRSGTPVTAQTNASGAASLDLSGLTGPYRVYTSIPGTMPYLEPAPAGVTGPNGERKYDPLVAFVDIAAGDSPNLLQAVWNPAQWVQPNPDVLLTLQRDDGAPATAQESSRVVNSVGDFLGYSRSSTFTSTTGGSLWGAAYDRTTDQAYLATMVRRDSSWANTAGTGTNGTIYVKRNPRDNTVAPTVFATIPNTGTTQHSNFPVDPDIFGVVGKEGLGDIALNADGSVLYVVNLFDKQLYALSTATGAIIGTYPIPVPADMAGRSADWRPFGLGFADGTLYIGGVDSAESVTGTNPQRRAELTAYVYTFNGATMSGPILTQSLDYLKGSAYADNGHVNTDEETHWNAWKSTWDGIANWGGDSGGNPIWLRYPQPMLTDITIEPDGSLVLGLRDRTGAMGGSMTPAPDGSAPLYQTMSGGDLLRMCKQGGGYLLNCGINNNVSGRGGPTQSSAVQEYYAGEWIANHQETAMGASVLLPNGLVLGTSMVDGARTGYSLFDNTTGARTGSLGVTSEFGKAGGIGGIAVLASAAIPLQLGNRTWFDTDGDGIQEAGDPDLPGVTVNLLDANGNQFDTTTTDANGLYYFGTATDMTPGTWTVEFDYSTATLPPGVQLSQVQWTLANQGSDDQIQSKAVHSAGLPTTFARTAPVTMAAGDVNHTLDAGIRLIPTAPFTLAKQTSGVGLDELAPGATFTFRIDTIPVVAGYPRTVSLTANPSDPDTDFRWTSDPLPVGTIITVTETAPDDGVLPDGLGWVEPPSWNYGTNNGASTSFTLTDDEPNGPIELVAINTAEQTTTSVALEKELTSAVGGVNNDTDFTIQVSTDGVNFTDYVMSQNDDPVLVDNLDIGSTLYVREGALPPLTGSYRWGDPVLTVDPAGDSSMTDGVLSFTVTAPNNTRVQLVTVTNTPVALGTYSLTKTLAGTAAGTIPVDTTFNVEYSTDRGTNWSPLSDIRNGTVFNSGTFEFGTEIWIRETVPADTSTLDWKPAQFFVGTSPTPVTIAQFTLSAQNPAVSIRLTNTVDLITGSFTLEKLVSGIDRANLPQGASFSFGVATTPADPAVPSTVTLDSANNFTYTSPQLTVGTQVTITEAARDGSLPAGYEWVGSPTWNRGTTGGNGFSTTVGITAGAPLAVTATKTARLSPVSVELRKLLTSSVGGVNADTEFPIEVSTDGVTWTTYQVAANEPNPVRVTGLQPNTVLRVREGQLPALSAGYTWGTPALQVSPTGDSSVTDGILIFTVAPGGGAIQVVTVTNTPLAPGTFSLHKSVTGTGAAAAAGEVFNVEYSIDGGAWTRIPDVTANSTFESDSYPINTRVRIRETPPADTAGLDWGDPIFTVGPGQPGSTAEFTITGSTQAVSVELENPVTQLNGSFTLQKLLQGITANELVGGAVFRFGITTVPAVQGLPTSIDLSGANLFQYTSPSIPVGTSVTITETDRSTALPPGWVWQGNPDYNVGTETGFSTTFSIGTANQNVAVTATNAAVPPGGLSISKMPLIGNAAGSIPANTAFEVRYTVDLETRVDYITAGSGFTVAGLPLNTQVTITEVKPVDSTSLIWSAPQYSVGNGGFTTERPAFTITDTSTPITVRIRNEVSFVPTALEVRKVLTAVDGSGVDDDTAFPVTVTVGSTVYTPSISVNQPFRLESVLPGTTVTVTEPTASLPDLPEGWTWATPQLTSTPAPTSVVDGVLTFVVGPNTGTAQFASVTNTPVPPGGFTIAKAVTGTGQQTATGQTFDIQYSLDEGATWITPSTPFVDGTTFSSGDLELGQMVWVRETPPTDTTELDWGTPVYTIGTTTVTPTTSPDGYEYVSFTIESSTETVQVGIQNPVTLNTGDFTLTKLTDGVSLDDLPDGAEFLFTISGVSAPVSLNSGNDWTYTSGQLTSGTVVTITELVPGDRVLPPGYRWLGEAPVWSPGPQPTPDGYTKSITIGGAGSSLAVTATNLAEAVGTFTVTKSLSEEWGSLVPADTQFQFSYTVDGTQQEAFSLTPGQQFTSPEFPLGAEIVLTETTPEPPDGANFTYSPAIITVDGTEREPGYSAEFSIGDQPNDVTVVGVENQVEAILGTFSITKQTSGIALDELPAGTAFSFDVTVGGVTVPDVQVSAASDWTWTLPEPVLVDTPVTISEVAPVSTDLPEGYVWFGSPSINGGENALEFDIQGDTEIEVTAVNTALAVGSFELTKIVTGAAESQIGAEVEFEVQYTIGDQEYVATVTRDQPLIVQPVPANTLVTITEVRPVNTATLIWSSPGFSVDGGPVFPTASFQVTEPGQVVEVVLDNPVNPPLPFTGTNPYPLLAGGIAVVLIGLLAMLLEFGPRRRRRDAQTDS